MTAEVAIVGAATAGIGWDTPFSSVELMAKASHDALEDAGMRVQDVDAIYAATPYYWMPSVTLAEQCAYNPGPPIPRISAARRSSRRSDTRCAILPQDARALTLIAYGSTQRSDGGKLVTRAEISPNQKPDGALFPISGYALVAQRHMYEFGTTRAQLAEVAVSASQWAHLNPEALKRELFDLRTR